MDESFEATSKLCVYIMGSGGIEKLLLLFDICRKSLDLLSGYSTLLRRYMSAAT